ncbi:hypothetical protein COLO4_29001 [Corchorus olitorius]|uniref:Uncharacterized protein n=1 Tax=Corchorus olitorius TaxID=93759 RepID=A0A1R3HGY9_9ROSI|nr:hypothetical protein COLO4_29001 [Corchorus olitorius]
MTNLLVDERDAGIVRLTLFTCKEIEVNEEACELLVKKLVADKANLEGYHNMEVLSLQNIIFQEMCDVKTENIARFYEDVYNFITGKSWLTSDLRHFAKKFTLFKGAHSKLTLGLTVISHAIGDR